MKGSLKICYHGTTAENAEKIRREGFLRWTYFGEHLEDAVEFGGGHLFEVVFPAATTSEAGWQFRVSEPVPPDRIVRHYVITKELLYEDEMLGQRVFASNMPSEDLERLKHQACDRCETPLDAIPWDALWHRDHGLVELCSQSCAEAYDAEQARNEGEMES